MKSYRLDLSALVVAIIALGFSIWQGREQVRHNHISVEPRLTSYFSIDGKQKLWGVYVINNGMGTGFVEELNVFVDGKKVQDHEWGPFFSALIALELNPNCFRVAHLRKNDSLQVGVEFPLIEANQPHETPMSCLSDRLLLVEYMKERLDYHLKIESLYGIEFEYRYMKNEQVRT